MAADDTWRTTEISDLFGAILRLDSPAEAERFFRDLCTLGELHDMAQRWSVARMLDEGLHYAEISQRTGASTATITRIASWLRHGEGGYRLMLDRLAGRAVGRGDSTTVDDAPGPRSDGRGARL
jgi:TrpR-related protein YerC/YecD